MTTKPKEQDMSKKMDDFRKQEDEQRQQRREMLRFLLDQISTQKDRFIACHAKMGGTPSFITSAPLKWVAQNVRYAGQLPIFKNKADPVTHGISADGESIEYLQQRAPDWTRQIAMTAYLLMRKVHKFPPLLVVAYQNWVYEQQSDEWSAGIATKDSINALSLDNGFHYFEVDAADTNYYALDGQHRLMAIQGLDELIKKQRLQALKADRTPTRKEITLEQIIEWLTQKTGRNESDIRATLENIMSERIGIEIIPAVLRKETHEDAVFRLRTIFIDVNENARRVHVGERHLLDETEGFRIIARKVMTSCPLLMNTAEKTRTVITSTQLSDSSEEYTILDTVVKIAEAYLGQFEKFSGWTNYLLGFKDFGKVRPDEHDLKQGEEALMDYFNAISLLPSHKRFLQGANASKLRMKQTTECKDCEDNVLFRPIAQMAFAKAIGALINEKEMDINSLMRKVSRYENRGQLKLTDPKSPWFGVLCDPIDKKMRRQKSYQNLATDLFIYILGGGYDSEEDQKSLKERLWAARCTSEDNNKAYNFEGKNSSENNFDLPHPWQ